MIANGLLSRLRQTDKPKPRHRVDAVHAVGQHLLAPPLAHTDGAAGAVEIITPVIDEPVGRFRAVRVAKIPVTGDNRAVILLDQPENIGQQQRLGSAEVRVGCRLAETVSVKAGRLLRPGIKSAQNLGPLLRRAQTAVGKGAVFPHQHGALYARQQIAVSGEGIERLDSGAEHGRKGLDQRRQAPLPQLVGQLDRLARVITRQIGRLGAFLGKAEQGRRIAAAVAAKDGPRRAQGGFLLRRQPGQPLGSH